MRHAFRLNNSRPRELLARHTRANTSGIRSRHGRTPGTFVFDGTRRSLGYSVTISGVPAEQVYGVNIVREADGKRGAVLRRLVPGAKLRANGTLTLGYVERQELLAWHLKLVVYTRDNAAGHVRATMLLPD